MNGFRSVVVTILPLIVASNAYTQSLGDLAKKEEERRRAIAQPAKVYTNADLKGEGEKAATTTPATDRVAPAGTTQSANEQTKQPASTSIVKSAADTKVAALRKRFAAVRQMADEAIRNFERYEAACRGKLTQSATPQGIPLDSIIIGGTDALVAQGALLPPGTGAGPIANETTPQCRLLWNDMTTQVASVRHDVNEIEEDARRAGVLPGVVRNLREEFHLVW